MELVTIIPYNGSSYGSTWKLPQGVAATEEKKISAQFERETQDTLRGFTPEEEKKWLPNILGVSVDSQHWREATREFWSNITILVPDKGLVINKAVREDGTPESMQDYIKWRFIKKHSEVAMNKNLVEWPKTRFYVEDPEELKAEQEKEFKLRNAANKYYFELMSEGQEKKIEWVASEIRDKGEAFNRKDKNAMLMYLEGKKDKDPRTFIRICKDPDLEQKALISKLLEAQILEKNGNSYFYDGDILGVIEEAIAWLKNPAKSKQVLEIQEKLKAVA